MAKRKTYYFYVLFCRDESLYGGYTVDLAHRLETHNAGKGAKYTRARARRPVKLIYAERWPSKSEAMRAEYQFKQLDRASKINYLEEHGQLDITSDSMVLYNQMHSGEEDSNATTEEL